MAELLSAPADAAARPVRGGAIVLIGFMGAGKTTTAKALARAGGLRACDVDQRIEAEAGRSVAEIFASDGEAAFRACEQRVACELLTRAQAGEVISLGGGALGTTRVREALAEHIVVWLAVDPATAWRRVRGGGRPLARGRQEFEALHAAREPLYAAVADVAVPALAREHAPRLLAAIERLRGTPPGTRLIWASAGGAGYPVWIGRGTLGAQLWPIARGESRRFLVTDTHVSALWGAAVGEHDGELVIEAGEQHKTPASAERLWRGLAARGARRGDHLVALGGGVVGDLAGFVAATYMRGLPVVQAPTTLLAAVDSAYGGKTGVDLPEAKNYVGAYHQPSAVLADTSTLATLPAAERSAGYAEVAKTALIAGGRLWDALRAGSAIDDSIVFDCALTKLSLVAQDERDDGRRQVLNLGHTVGHAIEAATGYRRYRHGEAVALGLLAALRLSGQPELHAEVSELLARNRLPTSARGVQADAVLAAIALDKKREGEDVRFVLLSGPGAVRHGQRVPAAELEQVVRELCA